MSSRLKLLSSPSTAIASLSSGALKSSLALQRIGINWARLEWKRGAKEGEVDWVVQAFAQKRHLSQSSR